jgi:hypothetical protein
MRPTTAFEDNVFDFNALLHPGTIFDHPCDVLAHPSLSVRRNAPSLHLGHPTHRRSLPALRCGHRPASRPPSPSTRSWKPCANSMTAPAIRLAASRTACVLRQGRWRLSREKRHGRNQTTATRGELDRTSLGSQICEDAGTLPAGAISFQEKRYAPIAEVSAALNQGAVPPRRSLLSRYDG